MDKRKLDEIKNIIIKPMQELNIIVDSVIFEKEGRYNFLRITLDKVNGIDLDTIVEATNIINPLVDKLNICDDSYILDIVSKEKGDIENE